MRTLFMLAVLLTLPGVVAALTLSLDQDVYILGDVIEITYDNTDGVDVRFTGGPPFSVTRLDGDYPDMVHVPVIIDLLAGETMVEVWDTSIFPDPPGSYQIEVSWETIDDPVEHCSEVLPYSLIDQTVATEGMTLSAVRGLFR